MAKKSAERLVETSLWNFRYVIIIAVITLLFSSLIAFYLGVDSTFKAFEGIQKDESSNLILVYLISSIDEFLLGIVLIIIALGIYELFISKIDGVGSTSVPYPRWLTFHSLEELKGVLTKVIIIILMVYFFKSVVVLKFDTPLDILYLAVGIVLIAVANYLSHKKSK